MHITINFICLDSCSIFNAIFSIRMLTYLPYCDLNFKGLFTYACTYFVWASCVMALRGALMAGGVPRVAAWLSSTLVPTFRNPSARKAFMSTPSCEGHFECVRLLARWLIRQRFASSFVKGENALKDTMGYEWGGCVLGYIVKYVYEVCTSHRQGSRQCIYGG